jgi:hypothetical protein
MKALMRTGIATLATSVGAGLVVMGVSAANAGDDQTYAKREDNAKAWVLSADDDDDGDDDGYRLGDRTNTGSHGNTGTRTRTRTGASNGTDHSREDSGRSGDRTGSRYSGASRDRDHSRGDKSRDWTRDGKGGATRDFSANLTNDRSRNDTRR